MIVKIWEAVAGTIWRGLAMLAAFVSGYRAKESRDVKKALQTARAQRDLANRPDPDVDAVADWLSGDDGRQ